VLSETFVNSRSDYCIKKIGQLYTVVRIYASYEECSSIICSCGVDPLSTLELNDGSCEIVILKAETSELSRAVLQVSPGLTFNKHYNPLEPGTADIDCWGYIDARKLVGTWFFERALMVIRDGEPRAAAFYKFLLDRNTCPSVSS
jgi:hypothetical protein